jgi:poly(beta-D-mannuronate) C5 epimerase
MRLMTAVLMAWLLVTCPARAEADAGLQAQIRAAWAGSEDPEVLMPLAGRLAPAKSASVVPAGTETVETAPLEVRAGEIQAALTQLSILSGGNGHLSLQLAQASGKDVIYLVSGAATLADLGDLIQRRPDGWHLSRPLVIWPGASLEMSPGDELELDTAAGAFVLSFGSVRMTGATLRGDAGRNPVVPTFRPFLLVTGQGTFRAEGSTFADLGFRGPVAFRGVTVLTGGLMKPAEPPLVAGNRFEQVFSLSFEGADGMVVTENRFAGAGAAAVSIRDGTGVTLVGNRIVGTAEGAGIRLSGRLKEVALIGNLVSDGGRNGVQVDGTTEGLTLRGNVVTGNAETGVSIRNATCAVVEGNILAGNGTTGLRLQRSGGSRIADNAILDNAGSGLELSAQGGLGPVVLADNLVAANREGLRAAGLGEVQLAGNDLDDQLPRQFSGDFAPWLGPYLTADATLVIPAAAGTQAVPSDPCQTE